MIERAQDALVQKLTDAAREQAQVYVRKQKHPDLPRRLDRRCA